MKRVSLEPDHSDPGDEDKIIRVPPLSDEEITEIRWLLFGCCPVCSSYVKGWSPGAFHAERYQYWRDTGIDPLTGHKLTCTEKWRRA